ncbi:MAG: serine hydrolase domain-containing protein [Pseudomonadota bacterium]
MRGALLRRAARFRALLLSVAMLLAGAGPGWGDEGLQTDLERLLSENALVGFAYALVEDGEVTAIRTLGAAEPGGPALAGDALFRLGSVSKNLTSLLVLDLVAEGAIDLHAPLDEELQAMGIINRHAAEAPITMASLLEHTAGLPGSSYRDYTDAADDASPTAGLAAAAPVRTRWSPGRYYSYANIGHTIAARLVERRLRRSFDAAMAERVLQPLGMTSASFAWAEGATTPSFNVDGSPAGYLRLRVRPSGGATANIADFAKLVRFHASGGATADIATPALIADMRRPRTSLAARAGYSYAYALGTFGFIEAGRLFWGHWGRIDGFHASFGVLPATGAGFALVANTADRRGVALIRSRLAQHLAARYPAPPSPPQNPPEGPNRGNYEGWWMPFTENMVRRTWISALLGLTAIEPTADGLCARTPPMLGAPMPLIPAGAQAFRHPDMPMPTHVFAYDGDGLTLLGAGQQSFVRLAPYEVFAVVTGTLLAIVSLVVAPVGGLVSLGYRLFGREKLASGGVWAWLAIAALVFLALQIAHVAWGMLAPLATVAELGVVGARSLTLAGLSIAWPAAVGVAAILLYRHWRLLASGSRWAAAAVLCGFLPAAILLASQGWMPLLTWR